MKKLNRKGFTLIELLAVIVILAIILVVTVPNIISSINDARVSSIHNMAKSAANTYDNAFAQDLITTNKILGDVPSSISTSWQCIDSLIVTADDTTTTDVNEKVTLTSVLDLSENDVVLDGNVPTSDSYDTSVLANTCSSIRLMANGSAEVLLVAKSGGKFYVAQYNTYAVSSADAGAQNQATSS